MSIKVSLLCYDINRTLNQNEDLSEPRNWVLSETLFMWHSLLCAISNVVCVHLNVESDKRSVVPRGVWEQSNSLNYSYVHFQTVLGVVHILFKGLWAMSAMTCSVNVR